MESPIPAPAVDAAPASATASSPMPKNLGVALLALLFILPLILAFVQLMRRQQQGDDGEILLAPPTVDETLIANDMQSLDE